MSPEDTTKGKVVKIAIAGLGRVGSLFLQKISENSKYGVEIVAAVDFSMDAPGRAVASDLGITLCSDTKEIVAMGDSIDLIFDLTGNADARGVIRGELARSGNQHTVLAPEVVAFLLWNMMSKGESFPDHHAGNEGY